MKHFIKTTLFILTLFLLSLIPSFAAVALQYTIEPRIFLGINSSQDTFEVGESFYFQDNSTYFLDTAGRARSAKYAAGSDYIEFSWNLGSAILEETNVNIQTWGNKIHFDEPGDYELSYTIHWVNCTPSCNPVIEMKTTVHIVEKENPEPESSEFRYYRIY